MEIEVQRGDPAHWWLDQYGKQITGQMNIFDFIDEE